MPSYAVPLSTAFFVFFIIAFVGTIPWTIYQYRKYGYFSFWRNLIIFSFIYYCLSAFFLVSLPLPKDRNNVLEFKNHVYTQLKPFNMLNNFKQIAGFNPSNIRTYPTLFKSFTFLEVAFNIALLFPLGIYLRFFFKKINKWYLALLIILSTTLFFEISQLTALFGYYTYPYRLFDVDDLLMNTFGGMLGFLLAPVLLKLIPSRDQIKQQDQVYTQNQLASYGSQLIELFVSVAFARILGTIFSVIFFHGSYLFIANTIFVFLVLVIFPIITKGKTIGGKIVKIKFSMSSIKDIFQLIYRFLLIYFPSVLSQLALVLNNKESSNAYIISAQLAFTLLSVLTWIIFWAITIKDWSKKRTEPFFNRLVSVKMLRY